MIDVNSIVNSLLIKYPLFGSVIANINFKEDKNTRIASTDGNSIFYNDEFVGNLSEDEQVFVFAHEVCHIAFDHIYRSENKDIELWNIATDSVINALLKEDGLEVLKNSIYDPEAINYNAEEMYENLLRDKKNSIESNDKGTTKKDTHEMRGSIKKGEEGAKGHDDHSLWRRAVEEKKQVSGKSDGQKMKDDYVKKLTNKGENKAFHKNRQIRSEQMEKLIEVLSQKTSGVGDTSSSLDRLIENIGTSKPLLDWRRVLRESLRYDVDWSYSNATIEEGVVTAHLDERPYPLTEIVLDTSGSISKDLLRNFLRECKNIIKNSRVRVGCFDTKFYGFKDIKSVKEIDKMNFVGGGGTNFAVAIKSFSKRADNKIIFTDGEATMPSIKCNAIWVVFGNRRIHPNGGKVIYIDDEQLKRLRSIKIKKR